MYNRIKEKEEKCICSTEEKEEKCIVYERRRRTVE